MKRIYTFLLSMVLSLALFAQSGKPVIGISSTYGKGTSTVAPLTYVNSVIRAGGVPLVFPLTDDEELLSAMLERVDAVIMTGGEDIDPLKWYGEEPLPQMGNVAPERDAFDIALIRLAVGKNMPLMGICRGHQALNVAFGGTLYQDIPSQIRRSRVMHRQKAPGHYGTHKMTITAGSLMHQLLGSDEVNINSYHHQAVKDIAEGFVATAFATDGVIEAMENIDDKSVFGVQFHPEKFTAEGIDTFLPLFEHLIKEAKRYRNSK